MTRIILVRHGQTAWNREERFRGHADVPLDEIGFAQAKATAERIGMQWKPDAIYAGPLSRTVKTAEPTAQSFDLKVQVEPDLIDVDCGQWQGLTPDEVRQRWPVEFQAYLAAPRNFQFPGGESLEQARKRAIKRVEQLIALHPDQTIVLVSHTALNRLILLTTLDLDSHSFWKIRQDTCAINYFESQSNHFTLITLNETSHLLSLSAARGPVEDIKTV
ncbi:MAG: histidine phosphatase family protein [Chloroflexi bacterium]|nr:histidine phosphatase family protein [Chloroflexota bacterium]